MTWIKGAGTIMVTLFIFVIVGAWLLFTATKVNVAPIFNSKGIEGYSGRPVEVQTDDC